ncbi:hypothetical protein HNR06_001296 [Nocardiopsis arvandica]|uniref:Glycerophosphoryl diester phosphodiesterase membrane domain-containing protein n=1 Tax=Nocardiopsis sinuspersici TaxID=501010 RepID=A0A7Z0BJR7_9ACTN|nr:glycerophosphoryl diester phosphodiesterase membrane domain-containing protein [Nocardiopsis sinuspersici]NYH51707.1 hypothetical protein [Nocardiopsis sinuspersici]
MTQEDDPRDTSGDSPDEPGGGGTPESAPRPEPGDWTAPGQGPSAPATPPEDRPGFAPPEQGGASHGQPSETEQRQGYGHSGYGLPGHPQPSGQQGYGQAPGHGQQYGYGSGGQGYGGQPPNPDPYGRYGSGQQQPYAATPPGYGPPPGHGQQPQYGQQYGYGAPHGGPRAPKPGVVALRPMTLGDILNGAFSVIRNNPKTTVGLSLVVMAIASIISSIGFSGYMSDYGVFMDQVMTDPASVDPDDPLPFSAWSIAALYGGSLLSYAGTILVTGLLTAVIGMAVLGRKLTPSQAWAVVKDRIGAVIGLALLQLLIVFGLTLVITVVGVAGLFLGIYLAVSGNEAAGVTVIVAALVLGVLGGIALAAWIYVRIYFAMPVVVLERLGVGASLARSWRLTQGSWWRVFGITLLAYLLIGLVGSLLSTPLSIVAVVPSFVAPGETWAAVVSGAVIYVSEVLVSSITTPFTVGVATLLYVDLRMRREGLDLKLHEAARAGYEAGPEIYLPEPRT